MYWTEQMEEISPIPAGKSYINQINHNATSISYAAEFQCHHSVAK